MHHGASAPGQDDPGSPRRARLGRWLCAFYSLFYLGFVLLNAFANEAMGADFFGSNVAVSYGLALIGVAFFLAIVYDWLCRPRDGEAPR